MRRNQWYRIVSDALAGTLAGFAACALDASLARVTLRYPLELRPQYVVGYLLTSSILGIALGQAYRLIHDRHQLGSKRGTMVFAATALVLYAAGVAERLQYFGARAGIWWGATAAVLGGGTMLALPWLLARWLPVERTEAHVLIVATLAAFGLAANSNALPGPLSAASLAADSGLALAAAVAAVALSRLGPKRGGLVSAFLAAGVVSILFWSVHGPILPPTEVDARPASIAGSDAPNRIPPNLILVVIDTLRYDVFQSVIATTPEGHELKDSLDKSAWFSNATAAAPWTVPSMGSILTGLYPSEHGFGRRLGSGVLERHLHPSIVTLAQRLRKAGYRSVGFVANSYLDPSTGIGRGFDSYELVHAAGWKIPLVRLLRRLGFLHGWPYASAAVLRRYVQHESPQLAVSGSPLFLWIHLMDPHSPLHEHPTLPPEAGTARPELDHKYRAEVRYAALELSRILRSLAGSGLMENSVVVVLADHGEMLPSDKRPLKSRYGHGHAMYEELLHVPLVIRPPGGLPAERHVDALVSHVDIPTTIADLVGLHLDLPRKGRHSLTRYLGPPSHDGATPLTRGREYVVASATGTGPRQRVLRERDWKLISYRDGEQPTELYRLSTDPLERVNRADQEPDILHRLENELRRHWKSLQPPPASTAQPIDPEMRDQLRTLGYVDQP